MTGEGREGAPEEDPAGEAPADAAPEGAEETATDAVPEADGEDAAPEASGEADEPPADAVPEGEAEEAPADPAPDADETPADADETPADAAPAADEREDEAPATGPPISEVPPADVRRPVREPSDSAEEVIPGAHLEPDLVLETPSTEDSEEAQYARYIDEDQEPADPEATLESEAAAAGADTDGAPAADRGPLDLARDARYRATGKRKTSVARVILRPGDGTYTLNGRALEEFFPRPALQKRAREALEVVGYSSRMDVTARLHGGGVSSQAGALRHGIARALVEADPTLRRDLKRRGFLTRDAREKERRKAGLKKARKRPQFSKR